MSKKHSPQEIDAAFTNHARGKVGFKLREISKIIDKDDLAWTFELYTREVIIGLAHIIFNKALAQEKGDLDKIGQHFLIILDDVKDRIFDELDFIERKYREKENGSKKRSRKPTKKSR